GRPSRPGSLRCWTKVVAAPATLPLGATTRGDGDAGRNAGDDGGTRPTILAARLRSRRTPRRLRTRCRERPTQQKCRACRPRRKRSGLGVTWGLLLRLYGRRSLGLRVFSEVDGYSVCPEPCLSNRFSLPSRSARHAYAG